MLESEALAKPSVLELLQGGMSQPKDKPDRQLE